MRAEVTFWPAGISRPDGGRLYPPFHYSPYHELPNPVKVSRAFFYKSLPVNVLTFVMSAPKKKNPPDFLTFFLACALALRHASFGRFRATVGVCLAHLRMALQRCAETVEVLSAPCMSCPKGVPSTPHETA